MRAVRSYGLASPVLAVPVLLLAPGCREASGQTGIIGLTWFLGILAGLFFIYIVVIHFPYLRKDVKASQPDQSEPDGPAVLPTAAPSVPPKRPSAMNDEELFLYLKDLIQQEQLYLNPLLDRQALISRSGVSAHRIGAAFSKGSDFRSLPDFIRCLRLEHACSLLLSCPDLSVKAVGESSGFSNNSTFCSDFKSRYGITPSDYRRENLPRGR